MPTMTHCRPKTYRLTPDVFQALDADDNGARDRDEVKGLTDIPSHIVLQASFGETNQSDSSAASAIALGGPLRDNPCVCHACVDPVTSS